MYDIIYYNEILRAYFNIFTYRSTLMSYNAAEFVLEKC